MVKMYQAASTLKQRYAVFDIIMVAAMNESPTEGKLVLQKIFIAILQ